MVTGKIHSSKSPLNFEDLLIIAEQSKSAGNLEGHINWLNIALGTNHILWGHTILQTLANISKHLQTLANMQTQNAIFCFMTRAPKGV